MRTILYILNRQTVNYVMLTLRSPKRLIPALIAVLSFVFMISMGMISHSITGYRHVRPPFANMGIVMDPSKIWAGLFVSLAAITIYRLVTSFTESQITFNLAQIDYLLPTPISRRLIMAQCLLKSYAQYALMIVGLVLYASIMVPMASMFIRNGIRTSPYPALLAVLADPRADSERQRSDQFGCHISLWRKMVVVISNQGTCSGVRCMCYCRHIDQLLPVRRHYSQPVSIDKAAGDQCAYASRRLDFRCNGKPAHGVALQ